MKYLRPNSIAVNITLVVLLATGIALIVFTAATVLFDSRVSTTQSDARLATLADIVGQNSAAALEFDDRLAAEQVLQALRKEPPIVAACLYNVSGSLFSEYYRDRDTRACSRTTATEAAFDSHMRRVTRQIWRRSEILGSIFLVSDMQYLESRRKLALQLLLVMAAFSLGIGVLAGSILQKRISRPIARLAQALHRVTSSGTFESRAPVEGSTEIMELASEFNSMLVELESRDRTTKLAEAQLSQQASTDALTGLPNRRLFSDRLAQTLALMQRERRTIGLLYIDLDGFKLVNDSLGHHVGDALLCEVASRFRAHVRRSDTLARVGGDEFTVILTALNQPSDAAIVAESLLASLATPFRLHDHDITIGASIGISTLEGPRQEEVDLLQQADSAMYAAKRGGRNQAVFFTAEMASIARERLTIESQLRGAVDRGEIYVAYQPEFELSTGNLVRFEALARWKHPTLGQIAPDRFIPVAEESGLIHSVGSYVFERACMEVMRCQRECGYPVQLAVNMSAIQFNSDHVLDTISQVLNRTGIEPRRLQIELTESVMVGSFQRSADRMRKMREIGLSIAIDDFGTGYSCLAYLPDLPIDAIKIDRSFTRKLQSGSETVKMVRSMIDLAHSMGMRVIVEGVEEEAQLKLLREIGADEVQGYLLGRPQDGSLKFDKSAASIEKRSCSEVFGFLSRGRVKRGLGSAT